LFFICFFSCKKDVKLGVWYLGKNKIEIFENHLMFNDNEKDITNFKKINNELYEFIIPEELEQSWKLKILHLSNDSLIVYDSLFSKTYRLLRNPLLTPFLEE